MRDLLNRLFIRSGSAFPLAFFRISFGGIMCWDACSHFYTGRINEYYVQPRFFFHYFTWDFIKPLPGEGMYVVFALMVAAALGVLLGWLYRWSVLALFVLFTYVFLLDQTHYLNHAYLLCLISFIMIFLPAANTMSIDARKGKALLKTQIPLTAMFLLRFQVAVVYIFGGIAKLNYDWLHGEPVRMWLHARKDFPFVGAYLQSEFAVYFFSYGGLLLDLFIIPLLLWKKTRMPALAAALAFHFTNALLFDIGVFPWFMIAATVILFVPEFSARMEAALPGSGKKSSPRKAVKPASHSVRLLVIAWCVLQLLIPLRHFIYPGNVSWTEEGHKFAWHMKLRSKKTVTRFFVEDAAVGKVKEISPAFFLTQKQIGKMAGNPDMLAQFCRFLKNELASQGIRNVRIRAEAQASLNGRKFQLLVDPATDLSSEQYSVLPAKWILPLAVPLHERIDFSGEIKDAVDLPE